MNGIKSVIKKELLSLFVTPIAYIYMAIFLLFSNGFAIYFGGFFYNNIASLISFFSFIPYIFLFFIPILTMKSFSEEYKHSFELLISYPVKVSDIVWGKFLAVSIFLCLAIFLTTPIWITINFLGNPDNLVILSSYFGCLLISLAYIAIGVFSSSLTSNQIISYIVALLIGFIFTFISYEIVIDFFPNKIGIILSKLSLAGNYSNFMLGIIDFSNISFFIIFTLCLIKLTILKVESKC